jgi:Zn-dependent membrane protease YugP
MYFIMLLPALVLAGIATIVTKFTFNKYSRVRASSGLTGAEAAERMLTRQGVENVRIERVDGFLSDHYDPSSRTLRLSPGVYDSDSLSAIGVACHEAGHALQHAAQYAPLYLRSALVPVTNIGTNASYIIFFIGLLMRNPAVLWIAMAMFSLAFIFTLVTLPVEWNATARAKRFMVSSGIVSAQEQAGASQVLNAAFLTYVAAAITALLTLLYYLMRSGLLGGRRND